MLSIAEFKNPLLWALMIGWIMSVVLHEFAHGVVAYWGGDYTIRERGGLTLNPLQYIDPLMSIILPLLFLLLGGVPLPGGATYIRRDLLRSKAWETAVSLAGPAMNFLLFLLLVSPPHPLIGWIDYRASVLNWTTAQIFVAGLAFSQMLAVLLNLVPVPPLDGFGAIAPYMPEDIRNRLTNPPWNYALFFVYFMAISSGGLFSSMVRAIFQVIDLFGINPSQCYDAFRRCLYGDKAF